VAALGNIAGWSAALTFYFFKCDQALLDRRLHGGPWAKGEPAQKRIQLFATIFILVLVVASALDYRFGWSMVPAPIVLLGNALVAIGFAIVFLVLRENSFAAATIEVTADQRVISTGPYALVRHPMYAGVLVLFLGVPPALGYWRGLLAILPVVAGLVARLQDEEAYLARNLPGYEEYRRKVRYRLVPGVW
jgi:protein-S-isoprenylcysteine O-methyltransferase Ste14